MKEYGGKQFLRKLNLSRRHFIKSVAAAIGITAIPLRAQAGYDTKTGPAGDASDYTRGAVPNRVYIAKNGSFEQNVDKIWDMLGGPESYFNSDDIIVIKANAQWPNQGYTHTGCIKAVIDRILAMQGFSGEILICDNVQIYGSDGAYGFDATPANRNHNWPDHNWNSLAGLYQANGHPVATCRWYNSSNTISGPSDGEGWIRTFWNFHGDNAYFSYPVFQSPLSGKMIDMKYGVWSGGSYTGQAVKTIVMATLNNHGWGSEDYAGITSAVKSFLGATEVHGGVSGTFQGHYNWHATSFGRGRADYCGELTALFIQQLYAPVLYITPAIWSGHESRTGGATFTNTVLACDNPATLDFIACRDIISPYAPFLDPTLDNNTRAQIMGCINAGIGSIDPGEMSLEIYDFDDPPEPSLLNVHRFFNTVKGGHLYTISEEERDYIIENLPEWTYEGAKFRVYDSLKPDTTPAYRFFNTITGIHIYTISDLERDTIMQIPEWNYEGIKFYVNPGQSVMTIPVYRFFNHVKGGHLFTVSEYERDAVMQLPEWNYEGIPFYVFPL